MFSSCSTLSSVRDVTKTELTNKNIKELNGRFQNREETSAYSASSFWRTINPYSKDTISDWAKAFVELRVDDKFLNFS